MKKFLFGWIIGFFLGVYSLVRFFFNNEELRDTTQHVISKHIYKLFYGEEGLRRKEPDSMVYRSRRTYSPYPYPIHRGGRVRSFNPPKSTDGVKYQYSFVTKEDAEKVLSSMQDILSAFSVVCVNDLHNLIGFPVGSKDNKKGWVDLRDVKIEEDRFGYTLILPETESIS